MFSFYLSYLPIAMLQWLNIYFYTLISMLFYGFFFKKKNVYVCLPIGGIETIPANSNFVSFVGITSFSSFTTADAGILNLYL